MKQFGAEAYRAQLDAASSYFHWLADRARAKFDMRGADGRMDAFKFLLPAVQKISDKLERAAVASDLAGYLGVEPGLVLEQFKRAATDRHAPGQVALASGAAAGAALASGAPGPSAGRRTDLIECAAFERSHPRADFAAVCRRS